MAVTPRQNPEEKVAGDLALKTKLHETIEAVFVAQAKEVEEARKAPFYFHPDPTLGVLKAVSAQLPAPALIGFFEHVTQTLPDETAQSYRIGALKNLSPENLRLLTLVCNNKITPTTQTQQSKAIQITQLPAQLPPDHPFAKLEVGQRFYSTLALASALEVTPPAIYSAFRAATATKKLPHCQGVFFQYVSILEEEAR